MPKRLCNCGSCEYCSAYTEFEMDCEFGTGGAAPRGDNRRQRVKNFIHLQQTEEMCKEFGTGGTTYEQRKRNHGPMPEGTDLIDSLLKK